jgi:hypothetical protein
MVFFEVIQSTYSRFWPCLPPHIQALKDSSMFSPPQISNPEHYKKNKLSANNIAIG